MASPSYRATTHSFLLSYIYNKLRRWIVLYYATKQYFSQTLVPVGCGRICEEEDCSQSVLQVGSSLHSGQSWSSHQAAHANQQVQPAINRAHTHTHTHTHKIKEDCSHSRRRNRTVSHIHTQGHNTDRRKLPSKSYTTQYG